MLKTDSLGDTIWTRTYGGEWGIDHFWGNCVRETEEGGYIISGTLSGKILIRTNEQGDTLWTKIAEKDGNCVEETSDGYYVVTGNTQLGFSLYGGNLLLLKATQQGDVLWNRSYGGAESDEGAYVQQTSDSGYIVTGYTYSFGAGDYDLYLLKTDSLGLLGIVEEPVVTRRLSWSVSLTIAPRIVIHYDDMPQGFRASVFDVIGRQVDELRSSGSSGIISWGDGYSPGVYFIRVWCNQQESTAKVVLIK